MSLSNCTFEDINNILFDNNVKTIVIATHNSPDGDAIGSICALEEILKNIGKEVDLIFQTKVSEKYKLIVGEKRINKIIYPKKSKYDLAILLDTGTRNMTYRNIDKIAKKFIIIDHHESCDFKCKYYLNNNDSSTGITIYNLLNDRIMFNEFISTCIYLSIISDTDCFKNNNTNANAYLVSFNMIKNNANFDLANSIHNCISRNYIKLLQQTLKNIVYINKNISYLIIREDDVLNSNVTFKEAGKIIDTIKFINDIDTVLLLIENKNSVIVRMRSKTLDCCEIMKNFNGGGHHNSAATIVYNEDIYDLKDKIIKLATTH